MKDMSRYIPTTIEEAFDRLSDASPRRAWEAIQYIAHSSDPSAHTKETLDRVTRILGNENGIVRSSAAHGLIRLAGFRPLLNALFHSQPDVRYGAVEALEAFGHVSGSVSDSDFGPIARRIHPREFHEGLCILTALLADNARFSGHKQYEDTATVAEAAAHALGLFCLPAAGAIGELRRTLSTRIADVHTASSVERLRQIVADTHIIRNDGGDQVWDVSSVVRACAAVVLVRHRDDPRVPEVVIEVFDRETGVAKCAATHCLGALRIGTAFQRLTQAVDDPFVPVALAAINALVTVDPRRGQELLERFVGRFGISRVLAAWVRPWSSYWSSSIVREVAEQTLRIGPYLVPPSFAAV
jgi:hypothetical protein